MLSDVLKNKLYVPPLQEAGWYGKETPEADLVHASMIDKEMGHVQWDEWTARELFLRRKVLENVWTTVAIGDEEKRLVIHDVKGIPTPDNAPARPGEFFACSAPPGLEIDGKVQPASASFLGVMMKDMRCVLITKCTVEGGKKNVGSLVVLQHLDKQKKRGW